MDGFHRGDAFFGLLRRAGGRRLRVGKLRAAGSEILQREKLSPKAQLGVRV